MPATPEQRQAFGRALAELRADADLSQPALAAELADHGVDVTPKAVSSWETGRSAPDAKTVGLLEVILSGRGQLLEALDYGGYSDTWRDEIEARR